MHYFTASDTLAFTQAVKIELQGENLVSIPQKSLRVTMTDDDGNDQRLSYPFFGSTAPTRFTSLVLRNDDALYARLREQVVTELAIQSTDLNVQRGIPVVLYLNGRYWGLYSLRERFDSTYFEEKFRLPKEALTVSELNWNTPIKGEVVPSTSRSKEDADAFNALLREVARCMGCVDFEVALKNIAMHDFIEYYLLEYYFGNGDWPYNNYKVWRYATEQTDPPESEIRTELDGRFRPLLFDHDVTLSAGRDSVESMIKSAGSDPFAQLTDEAFPLRNMFYDQLFGTFFLQRMNEMLSTTLFPANTDILVDTLAAEIRPEMPRQIERWKQYNSDVIQYTPSSMEEWELEVEMLKAYLRERPALFQKYAEDFFYSQL